MSERKYNFNPGPAVLPEEVVKTVRDNLLVFEGSGVGLMEMSHRSAECKGIFETTEANLRELLGIGDEYAIIFTGGGASMQFSAVPMNLLPKDQTADYIISGSWSVKAFKEAKKFGEVHEAGSSKDQNFAVLPADLDLSSDPAYVHFTSNNTIAGTQWQSEPEVGGRMLVCDASSDILHKKFDISKYGLIYAGAQKNLGPAGVTLVIVKRHLLERIPDGLPVMIDYRTYVDSGSLYNTPPVFAIYTVGEVLKWIKRQGGLNAIEEMNRSKAGWLYSAIDESDFYEAVVTDAKNRSIMNICFRLKNSELEAEFIQQATAAGLVGLKGHRSVGGLRASLYNAFPPDGVKALVEFMKTFAENNK